MRGSRAKFLRRHARELVAQNRERIGSQGIHLGSAVQEVYKQLKRSWKDRPR